MKTYLCDDILVKVDRASMAVSLEVRAPILDHKFMEFAATIPAGMKIRGLKGKYILKKAMEKNVPSKILNRSKMGFGVPMTHWLRTDLKSTVEAELFAQDGIISELFDLEYIKKIWSIVQHSNVQGFRKTDFSYRIWILFLLSRWFRQYISNDGSRQDR
jgi:asparagine synthase (glutamine-hydrolysing)